MADRINFTGRILEMSTAQSAIDVKVNACIDINTITASDDDPKFVNVEVIRQGISKTNNRRYSISVIEEINQLVPGVQGFLGHPDPSGYGWAFREPHCIFVGAMVDVVQPEGLYRVVAKAYLFKTSPLREWIPKSIAANNPMTVSINAIGDVVALDGIIDVVHISELQSIDWANPGTEGMGTSKALSVVNEMQNNNTGGKPMENKDIIANVTVTELKAYNPNTAKGILGAATIQELQAANPDVYRQIQESGRITEMQVTVGGVAKNIKLTELQGIVTGLENEVNSLTTKIKTAEDTAKVATITEFRNSEIAKQVPDDDRKLREKIADRIKVTAETTQAQVTEMIGTEIAYIREMGGLDNKPAPRQGAHTLDNDLKKEVGRLFGHPEPENK